MKKIVLKNDIKIRVIACMLFAFMMGLFGKVDVCAVGEQKKVKIVFVGNYSSGKSAVRSVLCGKSFDFSIRNQTLRSDKLTKIIPHGGASLVCELWDTSGKGCVKDQIINFRAKGANFVIITVDLSSEAREGFEDIFQDNLASWAQQLKVIQPQAHIILLGTKSDLLSSYEVQEAEQEMDAWAKRFKGRMSSIVVSAMQKKNIDGIFDIVKRVLTPSKLASLPDWEDEETASGESDDSTTFLRRMGCVIA